MPETRTNQERKVGNAIANELGRSATFAIGVERVEVKLRTLDERWPVKSYVVEYGQYRKWRAIKLTICFESGRHEIFEENS